MSRSLLSLFGPSLKSENRSKGVILKLCPVNITQRTFTRRSETGRGDRLKSSSLLATHSRAIGCGDGTWLSVFRKLAVDDILGIDGDYVTRDLLQIPQDRF